MSVKDEHIDELFGHKLSNISVNPPDDGWKRVEAELSRRSRDARRFWLVAASAAILLSATASYLYIQTNTRSVENNTVALVETQQVQKPVVNSVYTEQVAQNQPISASQISPISPLNHSNNQSVAAEESNSVVISSTPQNGLHSIAHADLNMPIYLESQEEGFRMKPIRSPQVSLLSKKTVRKEEPVLPKEQTLALNTMTPSTNIPRYDNIFELEEPVNTKSRNKWEVAGQFAPVYSYRNITSVPSNMNKDDFNQAESGIVAYSGGVRFAYQAGSRFSVQTGVYYSQMGQAINHVSSSYNRVTAVSSNYSYAGNYIHTSSGNAIIASTLKSETNSNYANYFNDETQKNNALSVANVVAPTTYRLVERIDYLEIPLIARYKFIDRKFNFYVLGGMSTNILLDNNVFMDNENGLTKEGSLLNVRPVNYSSILGLGISYQITKSLSVDLEPSFRYYLQSYTTNTTISSNPYSIGLFSGIVYRF